MKEKTIVLSSFLVILLLGLGYLWASAEWSDISRGLVDITCIAIHPQNNKIIYLGTKGSIAKSEDAGLSWRNILTVKGEKRRINFLFFDDSAKEDIYAATGSGLFYSSNAGRYWMRIFKGKNYLEADCTYVVVLKNTIYLGTQSGLFISNDRARTWHKENAPFDNKLIISIAIDNQQPGCIYVASSDGLYKKTQNTAIWERVFVAHTTKDEEEGEENSIEQEENEEYSNICYFAIDKNNSNLYLALLGGIYKSQDKAKTWEKLSSFGLLDKKINFLLIGNNHRIYALTKTGGFEFIGQRWQELTLALSADDSRFLACDRKDNLYLACNNGVYRLESFNGTREAKTKNIDFYFQDEPGISEVQEAAIQYAEVDLKKILQWRKQAARRALLPKVTVDMDYDRNKTISQSLWGTCGSSTTPGKYYIGPDDETRYNNQNWGISLSWELGDLIWNDAQTSIDTRSRLMVQLREDVLDEVNKTYFERIRVKAELDSLSIEERKKKFEKELRIQELTASLDALTGGYFSRQLE
jgi:photosystem II stability/assembly factor-like uncharacterized protein